MSLEVLGQKVVSYDQQDPLIGEVVYRGIDRIKTEARVFLDGQYIATMNADGAEIRMQPTGVHDFGWHNISGEVFWVRSDGSKKRIGCFRQEFYVSVLYRNAAFYWWRVDIRPYECY